MEDMGIARREKSKNLMQSKSVVDASYNLAYIYYIMMM